MSNRPASVSRKAVLFGVPLVLGLLELGHPAFMPNDDIFEVVAPIVVWWTALHVVQIPLFALLGLAVVLLVRNLQGRSAQVSRAAIAVFVVVYPAFDAAVGVSSGILIQNLLTLGADQRAALQPAFRALFWGPITGLLAIVASASWLVALLAAAWAWRRAYASRIAVALLAVSGLLLAVSHIRPFGPLGCLSFLIAAVLIERRPGKVGTTPAAPGPG